MKLSQIKKVMKADRSIVLVKDAQDGRFIGSKYVQYRAQDLPELDERSMAAILDMSVTEMREKYEFSEVETFPDGVVLADVVDVEKRLDWYGFELDGRKVYKGQDGAIALEKYVLKPFGDVELYQRWLEGSKGTYLVAKHGVSVVGVILSWDDLNADVVDELGRLYAVEQMRISREGEP